MQLADDVFLAKEVTQGFTTVGSTVSYLARHAVVTLATRADKHTVQCITYNFALLFLD